MIVFRCPDCQKTLQVQDADAGKTSACPGCRKPFVVPGRAAGAVAPKPAPARGPAPAREVSVGPEPAARPDPDVFVSYARKDDQVVYPIATRLRARGVHLWIDKIDLMPGDCFRTEISRAIERCQLVLFMCSAQSIASEFCFKEVAYASANNRRIVSLWLCPPCPVPGRLGLEIGPSHRIVLAERPAEAWLDDLMQALTGRRGPTVRRPPTAPPQVVGWRTAARTACQRRDWKTALENAQRCLQALPDDAEMLTTASTAGQWLVHEQNEAFSRIVRSRAAADWNAFLVRYPDSPLADHVKRKIAQLLPADRVEGWKALCLKSAGADPRGTGWRVAAAVCELRLGNVARGVAILDAALAVVATDAEALFFRAVAVVRGCRARLAPDRLQAMQAQLQRVLTLAPDCGLPDALAGLFAAACCEAHGLRCALGDARTLLGQAAVKGLLEDDLRDLQALVDLGPLPATVPPVLRPPSPVTQAPAVPGRAQTAPAVPQAGVPTPGGKLPLNGGTMALRWVIAAAAGLLVVGGITAGLIVWLSRSAKNRDEPTERGVQPARGKDVRLTVGDFVEMRVLTGSGDFPVTWTYRYEVRKIDGKKVQVRYTQTSSLAPAVFEQELSADLGSVKYLSLEQLEKEDQAKFEASLPKASINGKEVATRKLAGKVRKTWQFEGKDYPCLVFTWEYRGELYEEWYLDDPHFCALLSGTYANVRSTHQGSVTREVTAARFAAR